MCCADPEAWLYSSVLGESIGPSHGKSRQPGHQEPRRSGESALAVFRNQSNKSIEPMLGMRVCVCVCFGSECAGPCRESNAAGFPPGPSPRGAPHRQAHPVRSSAGLPRPRPHRRRFAQLQRPLLYTPGRSGTAVDNSVSVRKHTHTRVNSVLLRVSLRAKRRWRT